MIARKLRALLAGGTALSLAFAASPAMAQLVRAGDLVDAIDSGGNGGRLAVTDVNPTRTDMTVLSTVVVANWNRFNAPANTTINITPTTGLPSATLVNRVIGSNFSDISGTINAPNINLWLINQNGILFGDGAAVNSASFFASTLDVSNSDLFDLYEGTNLTGNGANTLQFSGSLGNAIVTSSPNVSFVTDGSLVFLSEQLNLNADFDAGTGRVSFVTAADVSVGFTPGSPLAFTVNSGSTLAQGQAIGGSVAGAGADFAMFTASGVMNAVLQVNATVSATTAVPTDNGVRLIADQGGLGAVRVELGGDITSTGAVALNTDGNFVATAPITGTRIVATAGTSASFDDLTATNGIIDLNLNGILVAGDVQATGNIEFEASNASSASFGSLVSSNGNVLVSGSLPGSISVSGVTQGRSISLQSVNGISLGDVSALVGSVSLESLLGGTINAGNVAAITSVNLDTSGALTAGAINAQTVRVGGTSAPSSAAFSGIVTANDFAASVGGALTFSSVNQIGTISGLSVGAPLSLTNDTSNLTISGVVGAGSQNVTIRNSGDLTLAAGGRINGGLVALSAGDQFINLRGSDAVSASDRWVVYSAAPAGNTFGNLDSGNNAIWNGTIDTVAPGSITGNRYVFAFQPTITVTSTDTNKVYGTDLTGALNGFFTVSGLQQGVAGAYLGDTVAGILSGAPLITSAGAVANADVVGGPYAMDISQGSLAATNGYMLAFDSAGRLTVTPKPITGSVAADNKTYDGTTAGTGTVTLTGVIAGDTVGTAGTTFTFADRNAGADKSVAVAGTTLTGADAGNYTLSVPASALADILARAITASVAVDNKTYDGTTAGTGTVTLTGVIAGDTVGTAGTTFTFADRNAGVGKSVAVAGTTLTGADAGNYTLSVPASALADILARLLIISADDQQKTQGASDPALTFRIGGDGLVAGESLSGALARQAGEAAGNYAITQGTLAASSNYLIQFQGGVLTITPEPITPEPVTPEPIRQVPLRAQLLPGDVPSVGMETAVSVDSSGLCPPGDGVACQSTD
jgi:filamentous hemagglutinin family protein